MIVLRASVGLMLAAGWAGAACAADISPPLVLERSIALPHTSGRIDHMDVDLARHRLFVAELGNDSADVIDLEVGKPIHRIDGLDEPQGVAYAPGADRLLVANGGDGSVRLFDGANYAPAGRVKLDDDADNAHLDAASGLVAVGHGAGGLALIDANKAALAVDIPLPAHPEGFAVEGQRLFVNLPDAGAMAALDLVARKVTATWSRLSGAANFPLAIGGNGRLAVVFRGQSRFALIDPASGKTLAALTTCADADDIAYDAKRKRYLVSCGEGTVDVIAEKGAGVAEVSRVRTFGGARTGLFVPELDRLFVAEPAGLFGSNASIAVFRAAEPGH